MTTDFNKPTPSVGRSEGEEAYTIDEIIGSYVPDTVGGENGEDLYYSFSTVRKIALEYAHSSGDRGRKEDDRVERSEYEHALNEIGQLQERLKDAEDYIRDLQRGTDH